MALGRRRGQGGGTDGSRDHRSPSCGGTCGHRPCRPDSQVTAYEPPNAYAFKIIAGPVRPEGSFTFAEAGNGTSVTMKLAVDIRGPQKFVFSKPAQAAMNATMKSLDKAKAVLET